MYTPRHNGTFAPSIRKSGSSSRSGFALNRTFSAVQMALLLGLGASALALMASPAQAQNSTAAQADEVVTLPSVTVKGQRDKIVESYAGGQVATGGRVGLLGTKDFMETPFNTISYTEQYIADQQARDISEVIAKTDPSVFMSGIAGESNESYSIRGFRSDVGDVTVNGLAGMGGYYRNSPEAYERVEVLKGPSALLNGMPPKGSAGGAVNLVTKRAGDDPLFRVTGSYMSDSHFGGHVDLGRRFGEDKQFGIRLNTAYRDGEIAVKDQDKKITQTSLGLDWRGERVRLSADLFHS